MLIVIRAKSCIVALLVAQLGRKGRLLKRTTNTTESRSETETVRVVGVPDRCVGWWPLMLRSDRIDPDNFNW